MASERKSAAAPSLLPRAADLLGQETALAAFASAIESDRVGTSYLLYGPPGVGRSLGATLFGCALLCRRPTGVDPCGRCAPCRLNKAGTHGDFMVASGATGPYFRDDGEAGRAPVQSYMRAAHVEGADGARKVIPVRSLRRLQDFLGLRAGQGGRKVVLLDGMEEIEEEGAATLLKSLEEPPPRTTFVLLAASMDRVIDTILSRCQRVRFRPLAPELVRELLLRHGGKAATGLAPDRLDLLVRIGQGSAGRSLEALRSGLHEAPLDAVRALLAGGRGDSGEERALGWVLAGGRDLSEQRARLRRLLALLLLESRDAAQRSGSADRLTGLSGAVRSGLESVQANVTPELVVAGLWVRAGRTL